MDECLFCQIAQGKLETVKVYEDPAVLCILDIAPISLGHLIVLPKQHCTFLFQLPSELLAHIMKIAQYIAPVLVNATQAKGFNMLISQGGAAGQRIPHFSINIIPRYENDGVNFEQPRKQLSKEQFYELAKVLTESFRAAQSGKIAEKKDEKEVKAEEKKEEKPEKKIWPFPQRIP